MLWFNLLAAIIICFGISRLFRTDRQTRESRIRLRALAGYRQAVQQGNELGLTVKAWHYLLIVSICLGLGLGIAYYTDNILLSTVGVFAGFIIPKIILEDLIYKRKRNVLINIVPNLRLLNSKFLEGQSLRRSLELSIPAMNGVTKPLFEDMFKDLMLRVDEEDVLEKFRLELRFSRVDDYCEKLAYSKSEGYHSKTIDSLRKTTDEISLDIQNILEIEIENKKRRFQTITLLFLVWAFPFMFGWFEGNMIEISGGVLTLQTFAGKLLLAILGVNTLAGLLYLNRWTRYDMNDS